MFVLSIKGTVHTKIATLTHPHVVPKLTSVEYTRTFFKELWGPKLGVRQKKKKITWVCNDSRDSIWSELSLVKRFCGLI